MFYFIDIDSKQQSNLAQNKTLKFKFSYKFNDILENNNIHTIIDVINYCYNELILNPELSSDEILEISQQINSYLEICNPFISKNLYYPNKFLARLDSLNISHLKDIPRKSSIILKKENITEMRDALNFIFLHLDHYKGIGKKNIYETKLSAVDTIRYYANLSDEQFDYIINEGVIKISYKEHILDTFSEIITIFKKDIYKDKEKIRNIEIFDRRYGFSGFVDSEKTLEAIGNDYKLTRERVRQILDKIKGKINQFLQGTLKSNYKLSKEIINGYITYQEKYFKNCFIELESLGNHQNNKNYINLYLEMNGYYKVSDNIPSFSLKNELYSNLKTNEINSLFRDIKESLYNITEGLTLEKLYQKIQKRHKDLSTIELFMILNQTNEIITNENKFLMKSDTLNNLRDYAYFIFKKQNRIINIYELSSLISEEKNNDEINTHSLSGQISADHRFTPIGKSGDWGLAEWGIENRTIKSLMIEALEKHQYLTEDELYNYVLTKRKVSKQSISIYLTEQSFIKENRMWRLRNIDDIVNKNNYIAITNEELHKLILSFFDNDYNRAERLMDLIRFIMQETHLKEQSVRQRLNQLNGYVIDIFKEKETQLNNSVKLLNRELPSEIKNVRLRDKIQNVIREILNKRNGKPIIKGDLYLEVKQEIECIRQTFYSYLSEMDDIEQYKEGNKFYVKK